MKAFNTGVVRAFDYFLAELLLGSQPKYIVKDDGYEDELQSQAVEDRVRSLLEQSTETLELMAGIAAFQRRV